MLPIDKTYQNALNKHREPFKGEAEVQEHYYSTQEVAGMLGVSKQTLMRYEKKKIFPKARRNKINQRREYRLAEIAKLRKIMGR